MSLNVAGSCDFCDQFFHRKQDFYDHANRDHFDIVCQLWEGCHQCPKFYPTRMSLRKHKVRFHSRKKSQKSSSSSAAASLASAPTSSSSSTLQSDTVNSQTCPFCLTHFPRIAHYYSHANAVHRDLIMATWSACPDCDKLFPTRRIRDRHRQGFRKRGELCTNSKNYGDDAAAADVQVLYEEDDDEADQYGDEAAGGIDVNGFAGAHFLAGSSTFAGAVSVGHIDMDDEDEVYEIEDEDDDDIAAPQKSPPTNLEEQPGGGGVIVTGKDQGSSCPFCGEKFGLRRDYYNHASVMHPRQVAATWKRCTKCPKYYPTQRALKNHVPKCNGPKNSALSATAAAAMMLADEEGVDPLLMAEDDGLEQEMDYPSYDDADLAMMTDEGLPSGSHLELPSRSNVVEETTVNGRIRVKCQFCHQLLSRKQDYYEHCNASHLREIALTWVACKKCYRFYPTRKIVRNHLENTHRKNPSANSIPVTTSGNNASDVEADDDVLVIDDITPSPPPRPPPAPKVAKSAAASPSGPQTTQCNFCHIMLPRKQDYYNHCHMHHMPQVFARWHPCSNCQRFYPTKTALANHRNKAHKSGEEATPSSSSFAAVPINNNNNGDTCDFCSERFTRKEDFYRHANSAHVDEVVSAWSACSDCGKFFPSQEVADRHRDSYKMRGDSCRLRAPGPSSISDVVLLDEDFDGYDDQMEDQLDEEVGGENWINCDFCDDVFDGSIEFFAHVNNCHLDIVHTSWTPCVTCGTFFPSKLEAKEHKRQGHCKRATNLKSSSAGSFKSPKRSSSTATRRTKLAASSTTVDVQNGKVRCPFCERNFGKEQYYYRHVNDVHREEVQHVWFACDGCGILFPNQGICFDHMKRARRRGTPCGSGGQSFCEICSLPFVQKSSYYKHVNDQHKDIIAESWHECDECNRFYPTRSVLTSHKQWYRAANKSCSSIQTHSNTDDILEDSEAVQSCHLCQVEFPVGLLLQHLSQVHGVSESSHIDIDETEWLHNEDEDDYDDNYMADEANWLPDGSEDEAADNFIKTEFEATGEVETLEESLSDEARKIPKAKKMKV